MGERKSDKDTPEVGSIEPVLARLRNSTRGLDAANVLGHLRTASRLQTLELYHQGFVFETGALDALKQEADNIKRAKEFGVRFLPEVIELIQDGKDATGVLVKSLPGCSSHKPVHVLDSKLVTPQMITDFQVDINSLRTNGVYPVDALYSHDNWYVSGDRSRLLVIKFGYLEPLTNESEVRLERQLNMLLTHPKLHNR